MMTIKEETTIVGVSEMRTKMDEILAASRKHLVIIEKRNKPLAVLIDAIAYARLAERMEILEDFVLAHVAKAREHGAKKSDYIDIETALKRVSKK